MANRYNRNSFFNPNNAGAASVSGKEPNNTVDAGAALTNVTKKMEEVCNTVGTLFKAKGGKFDKREGGFTFEGGDPVTRDAFKHTAKILEVIEQTPQKRQQLDVSPNAPTQRPTFSQSDTHEQVYRPISRPS